jgi:pimeloyl-ACP methyl ester carboxylesterase
MKPLSAHYTPRKSVFDTMRSGIRRSGVIGGVALWLTMMVGSIACARGEGFSTGVVKANGVTFHYLEAGKGPLVLALHGFPDHPRSYRHQLTALADAGYRVVAPYMRGYAPTETPEGAYFGIPALAEDAVALAEALSDDPVVLMGHDWGAAAAHAAAAAAPEKFSKLITMSVPYGKLGPSLVNNPEQQRRSWYMFYFQQPIAAKAVPLNNFAFIERLWQEWSPGWEYPPEELASVKATLAKPGVLAGALNYYRHGFNPPDDAPKKAGPKNPKIEVPTLYIHGRDDGCIGVELTDGMEKFFDEEFELLIIDGAGHFVHQERPEQVNRAIIRFLK